MSYNPTIHKRKSIRLKGYDYSRSGLYYITICCQNRECLFGNIDNGLMILNDAGKMVEKWYFELENKFPDIKCDTMILMPNHFHCIIKNVGADLCVCPDRVSPDRVSLDRVSPDRVSPDRVSPDDDQNDQSIGIINLGDNPNLGEHIGSPQRSPQRSPQHSPQHSPQRSPQRSPQHSPEYSPERVLGEHIGSPLHSVVQWFKTMTTNEYIRGVKNLGWKPFDRKIWQRDYYEHIIRDEQSYQIISNYIINNPAKWQEDTLYGK